MNNIQLSVYTLSLIMMGIVSATLPITASAAPGQLADIPLFLTNKAEPNIFFMVDDSGSMDFEMATDEPSLVGINGTTGALPVRATGGGYWGYFYVTEVSDHEYDTLGENGYAVPTQESVNALNFSNYMTGIWRARNHVFNRMYYNPNITYSPWPGLDNDGVAFPDAYINAPPTWNTRIDPYINNSSVVDLSATQANIATRRPEEASEDDDDNESDVAFTFSYMPARYWVWNDADIVGGSDNDGIVDAGDSKTLIEITNSTQTCANGLDATITEQQAGCKLRGYAAEMKNFANWWTYYRRREYASKNALGEVVNNSNAVRMGVATIQNSSPSEREAMASMNADITTDNKKNLADAIYSIQSSGGTPLLDALEKSGNYYDGSGSTPFGSNQLALDTDVPTGASGAPAECSQNFTILMTDGYYNGSAKSGYNNADSDNSSFTTDYFIGGTKLENKTLRFDGAPYADNFSNTLADIAMYYYERDLRPNTANKVPTRCGEDENPAQHMVTYTVAFGVNGSIDPDALPPHPNRGYANSCVATTGSSFNWTSPTSETNNTETGKIDELIHAAYNGRGEFLDAANPAELSQSLSNTIQSITSRIGAAASVSFNSVTLTNNSKLYKANFNSAQWSGELEAYSLDRFGTIAQTPDWQSSPLLNARDLEDAAEDRPIITFDSSSYSGVAFRWDNLQASQQNDLKTNDDGTTETETGFPKANARLDFIRGHRRCETGDAGTCAANIELRVRNGRLGDFINSVPVYSGLPFQRWPDQAPFGAVNESYTDFKAGVESASDAFSTLKLANTRTPMLFTGANDGMLHAVNADTGAEIFSYIPSMVYSTSSGKGLHALTEPSYDHEYYVDLSPTISQAYIDTGSGDDWHSILVGGMRAGGRGMYALNVTDPDKVIEATGVTAKETAVANMVMWEFTNADDANLGYTFSKAAIAPFGTKDGIEWYVVFGNGYNADTAVRADGSAGADGKAYLFLLKLEGPGANNTWDEGTDYFKISTDVGSTANLNGLSTPALIDLDRDSITDLVYAGDLHGNLWAFDVSGNPRVGNGVGSGEFKWASAYKSGNTPKPLFYATDGNAGVGNKQPITTKPTVIRHPTVDTVSNGNDKNEPNLLVYIGTGQYIVRSDLSSTSKQSVYAVWDKGDKERTVHRTDLTNEANHLVKKTFTNPADNDLVRIGGDETVDYTNAFVYGWYYDLPDSGERATLTSNAKGGNLFFSTVIPSTESCDFGGSSWELSLNLEDGSSQCGTFDTNGDGIVRCSGDNADSDSGGFKTVGALANEDSFLNGGAGGVGFTEGDALDEGAEGCPAQVAPAVPTCSILTRPTLVKSTDAAGCNTYTATCVNFCPEGKVPLTKTTTHSDNSLTQTVVCVNPNEGNTGRYSWRELPFRQ